MASSRERDPAGDSDELAALLRKVLELERFQGCRDSAVIGGFSRFVLDRIEPAGAPPALLEALGGYPALDPGARRPVLEALERWVEEREGREGREGREAVPAAPPPPPPRKANPTPPEHGRDASGGETPIQYVKGVGPKRAALLERLGITTRRDLLEHVPLRYEDRTALTPLRDARPGDVVTAVGVVRKGAAVRARRGPARYTAEVEDATGSIDVVWFGQGYLAKVLPPGTRVLLHGKVGQHRGRWSLQSPSFEVMEPGEEPALGLVPVYPLTDGLHQRLVGRLVRDAVEDLAGEEADPLPAALRKEHDLLGRAEALRALHAPRGEEDVGRARTRLAFEELFLLQVALAIKQARTQEDDPRAAVVPREPLVARLRESLPFEFTGAQARAVEDILEDLAAPRPMARLLQGDVGSGKTVVAASALMAAIAAGQQGALMAPTEILAEQHHLTFRKLCEPLGVEPELLLGGMGAGPRRVLLERLAAGECRLVIGTHALIEPDVAFDHLGLVVIDEQHRFGVTQRAKLRRKTGQPNLLVMTATPIPRTLSLTLYGDLDLTVLDEMPPGRTPIVTRWMKPTSLGKVWEIVRKEIAAGQQAYVVCPLIDESEKLEAQAASDLARDLAAGPLADARVGLLHGRLPGVEKDAVMHRFRDGDLDVLVATTVIEVGVDVPRASCMVILNAERFGLAQLHQLRGRVGRGSARSRCILVSDGKGEGTRERLKVLQGTTSGFEVAEADLRIRGPGEYFGTRQSGLPDLRYADLGRDAALLDRARQAARDLVGRDPDLGAPELDDLRFLVNERYARFLEYRH